MTLAQGQLLTHKLTHSGNNPNCQHCNPGYDFETNPAFKNPDVAFNDAIRQGRLNDTPASSLYAGKYMYMGTYNGVDSFKNINTREYI